ncbi:MAG: type II secretion system F family protein [Coriobacteriales bacterium]|jgi:type IV pilus assembly protein PilC|nr:type II secretion system F family protein [Coriobacteriales bacterium]
MSDKAKELTPAQLTMLFANLEMIIRSGLPLAEGFDILRDNAENSAEQALIDSLYQGVNSGSSLAETLDASKMVPRYAVAMLRIGEQTGRLEETFSSLVSYYSKRDELSQSIKSSVVYPLSMLVMVFIVVAVLLVQVMPVFDHVFRQLGHEMTGVSAILLQVGNALGQSGFWIAGIAFALVLIGIILALLPAGKRLYRYLFQNAPITRELSHNLSTQRFSLALSSMLSSGLELDVALKNAEQLVEDERARAAVVQIRADVDSGEGFLDALRKSGLFSHQDLSRLAVGSKTGIEAETLDIIGSRITIATENRLERLVAAIEPSLVAIMCIIVGLILLSVMLPLLGALTGF